MSRQTFMDVFLPEEIAYKARVMGMTWGHLAPKKNKKYPGYILFTISAYGDIVPIRAEFKGLDDSPWFYEALQDFVYENAKEDGKVYRFDGTFRNYEFKGTVTKLDI